MMMEIERKYLVKDDSYRQGAISQNRIIQGFINTHPERIVRLRIKVDGGFLTVKGISNATGTTRFEWETRIKVGEAEDLLQLCEPLVIDKTRYEVPNGKYLFEVDEFHGANEGLTIAEIELEDEKDVFERPEWLGEEVTGDMRYYNPQLGKNPFTEW
ncbi:MAG: adenylate cyclase [Maribacter sp.]|nr:MAG: adenylate cyclase [Maribacter sp.]